jgi:hypothetical protein
VGILGRNKVGRAVDKILAEIKRGANGGLEVMTVTLRNTDIPISYSLDTVLPLVVDSIQRAGYAVSSTHFDAELVVAMITVRTAAAAGSGPVAAGSVGVDGVAGVGQGASAPGGLGFLPTDALGGLERIGRNDFGQQTSPGNAEDLWPVVSPFRDAARADPATFVAAVAKVMLFGDLYAALGAASVVYDFVPAEYRQGPDYDVIMNGACLLFREKELRSIFVPQYLLDWSQENTGMPWPW